MGGPEAPDDLLEGCRTQVWLAVSEDPAARVTGEYFYHQKRMAPEPRRARYSYAGSITVEMPKDLSDTSRLID